LILIAGGLVIVCSLFVTATLKPPNKPAFLLSLYLTGFADIVLTGTIANTLYLINKAWIFIAIHLGLAILAGLIWRKAGRPGVLGPFADWRDELHHADLKNWIKREPALAALSLGTMLAYLLGMLLIVLVPQNNLDSLSTHLSRIGYWLQNGSFFPWPSSRIYQLFYPVNAQLQMFWLVLFMREDVLVAAVQWLATLVAGVGVFGLARWLGYSRRASAFATLIFLCFPLLLLQATTAQNDLVAAALFIPVVYFFVIGVERHDARALALSALSLGLGLGTKQTYYFLLPGLGLLVLLAAIKFGKSIFHDLVRWGVSCLVAVLVFTIYMNVVNYVYFGNPFGPPDNFEKATGDAGAILGRLTYNVPRLLYQALDTSGLPRPIDGYAHKVKALIAGGILDVLHFQIEGSQYTVSPHVFDLSEKNTNEESNAWYGPLSALLLFPALVYEFINGLRKKEYVRIALFLNAAVFLFVEVALRPGWDPYQGRYFLPIATVDAPLMAVWFDGKRSRLLEWSVTVLTVVIAAVTMLYNPSKPLMGKYADDINVWTKDRIFLQTAQRKKERDMDYLIAKKVPSNATLGLYTPGYILDYPLFGVNFTRTLIPIYPFDRISDAQWLEAKGIDYILVQDWPGYNPIVATDYERLDTVDSWHLYRRKPVP
jgi:4-amino-4-deoxy-L-arabinose transferase-like glycosyltransferase